MRNLYLIVLSLIACTCAGCFVVPSLKDPFGGYEAKITINDRNADARETIARYDHDARIVEAEQAAEATVNTARAWTGMIPHAVLLVVAGVIVVVSIHWQGRITLARLAWGELPARPQPRPIAPATLNKLQAIAAQRNQTFKVINGEALLIDKQTGEVIKRRFLKG